ncbi:MAG TPA: hypothetical protein PKA58_28000, partial [Polyangium sp.]|nr:hypothetical protein [Polyangium sp.]
ERLVGLRLDLPAPGRCLSMRGADITGVQSPGSLAALGPIELLDVGDVMHLGGTLYWLPSRYVGTVMKQQALLGAPAGTTIADALSSVAACDELGQTLVGFDTCDASCLAGLCREALAARWLDATEISGITGNFGLVNIAAVATTQVDQQAVPTSFQGTWLGSITDGNVVAKISKAELKAELPAVPPPP